MWKILQFICIFYCVKCIINHKYCNQIKYKYLILAYIQRSSERQMFKMIGNLFAFYIKCLPFQRKTFQLLKWLRFFLFNSFLIDAIFRSLVSVFFLVFLVSSIWLIPASIVLILSGHL